jgi:hypothetical protein
MHNLNRDIIPKSTYTYQHYATQRRKQLYKECPDWTYEEKVFVVDMEWRQRNSKINTSQLVNIPTKEIWAWGDNQHGQLGLTSDKWKPYESATNNSNFRFSDHPSKPSDASVEDSSDLIDADFWSVGEPKVNRNASNNADCKSAGSATKLDYDSSNESLSEITYDSFFDDFINQSSKQPANIA